MGVYRKKEDPYEYFREREEKNSRINMWFSFIELVILGLTIALCFYNWQLAIVSFIWLIYNGFTYDEGRERYCVDEIDMPDSAFGLRMVFRSWVVLLPLFAIGCILILLGKPIIALIYGFIAIIFVYPLMLKDRVFHS